MVIIVTKISQRMRKINWLNTKKNLIELEKALF